MTDDYHNYKGGSFGHCKCAERTIQLLKEEIALLKAAETKDNDTNDRGDERVGLKR